MSETAKTVIKAAAVLIVFGFSLAGVTLETEAVVTGISGLVAFVTLCVSIWKNFNFTKAAQQGQLVTNRLKNEERALKLSGEK
jgi:hypothetical protein